MGSTFTKKKVTITQVDPEVAAKIENYFMNNTKLRLVIKSKHSRCEMAREILDKFDFTSIQLLCVKH